MAGPNRSLVCKQMPRIDLESVSFVEEICRQESPEAVFTALMPALGERLGCDRIFLYLRDPQQCLGRVPFYWRRDQSIPEVYDPDWKPEPSGLTAEDPMFRAAVATQPSIFVEDVETASPEIVNRDFEAKTFGHRALIHAHLCQNDQLWGILQPAVFGQPRVWSQSDRDLIEITIDRITPLAVDYVSHHLPL